MLAMLTSMFTFLPVSAKDLNLPPGADTITYSDGGGEITVDLSSPLPANYPPSATKMRFSFSHYKMPNAQLSYSGLSFELYMTTTSGIIRWLPFAYITTDAYCAELIRNIDRNAPLILFNATLYGLPDSYSTDNVFVVS